MSGNCIVVVPWVTEKEIEAFLDQWSIDAAADWLVLQHDEKREGCGVTKNKGVARAVKLGAEIVVVLDSDCYPRDVGNVPGLNLPRFVDAHCVALEPQKVELFEAVTTPASRGTPYGERTIMMPVAASMGFWVQVGDYCAVRQLAHQGALMTFKRKTMFGRYFPLCGMNLAFKPKEWMPWCSFIDVPRFDDIWMGWLWQREAYRRGFCFNLAGPLVRHARQSNVWKNLQQESVYLEANETLWGDIATHEAEDYETLKGLLPCG